MGLHIKHKHAQLEKKNHVTNTRCKQNPDVGTQTSKCVSPHAHEIVTIIGQGAQAPLQEQI